MYIFTFLLNNFKIITGNEMIDTIIIGIISFIYFFIDFYSIKRTIKDFYKKIFNNTYCLEITSLDDSYPINFKAILWYVSNNNNNSIKKLSQLTSFGWGSDDKKIESDKVFIIDQLENFKITDIISGRIRIIREEKKETINGNKYIYFYKLYIESTVLNTHDLINWVEEIVKDYNKFIINKAIDKQILLTITYNNTLNIDETDFESSITFDNSYIPDKENILNRIDFFLNNKQWYIEKGIPYNLGILLHGEPGCGKTRFIKQLLNYTGRHGIDIKLNDSFDFDKLKKIIHNDKISDEYIIPQNKRIIIFEDIDAMCTILRDRDIKDIKDIKEKKKNPSENDEEKDISKKINNNNNLSFFLNMIDGLNECSGRIIIMTTNKIDYLDKAIIRPGRIDIKLNFGRYSKIDVCNIINKFWNLNINIECIKDDLEGKYTSAEILNIFRTTDSFENIKNIFLI